MSLVMRRSVARSASTRRGSIRGASILVASGLLFAACSGDGDSATTVTLPESLPGTIGDSIVPPASDAPDTTTGPESTEPATTTTIEAAPTIAAGAASRSVLPTVDGGHDYLDETPGWSELDAIDPDDPGVFVAAFDQGEVDVGNGNSDGSWVHDDVRATAVALEFGEQRVILVSTDTYMHFDADAVASQTLDDLPAEWAEAELIISATHNHHGPDTAFSINDDWYQLLANETAAAIAEAVDAVAPATISVASGTHGYGVSDGRDPVVMDPRLNVLAIDDAATGDAIATIVQWGSHPETTLSWSPPADAAGLEEACAIKGWTGDDCTAEGRYFTADYPGVLRDRLTESRGGEVLYFNGAIGNQIGPGDSPTWVVDDEHPVGNGWVVPDGAEPLTECDDRDPYLCRSFAKTESIGTQLAVAVTGLIESAAPVEVEELTVRTEPFFTRLTNIGFRVLIAEGDLGWQPAVLFTCEGEPSADACTATEGELEDDPVLTPLVESQITVGDVLESRVSHLDLGDVGFLFMPGELPPELVVGLPADFMDAPEQYYREPELHAVGADYEIPGFLLSLVDESITFTVGLGGDELGYWVPVNEYRLRCLDITLADGATCQSLADRGVIPSVDFIDGPTCKAITDDPSALEAFGADAPAVASICRYGQALGRELGEPDGHYEETNAAGWDLVEDLWAAATRLFGREGTGPVNPDNAGDSPLRGG